MKSKVKAVKVSVQTTNDYLSDEILKELDNFTGTEQYHKINILSRVVATDGFKHFLNRCKCYWLSDIVCSVQYLPKIREYENFIVWRIKKIEGREFEVCAFYDFDESLSEKDNQKKYLLYKQQIIYSDFPLKEYSFYQEGNVLLLKGEH